MIKKKTFKSVVLQLYLALKVAVNIFYQYEVIKNFGDYIFLGLRRCRGRQKIHRKVLFILHVSMSIVKLDYKRGLLMRTRFSISLHLHSEFSYIVTTLFDIRMSLVIITKTCLYNADSLKPHFYIVKLGFTGEHFIFLISAQKINCRYSLEPPRRGGSNEYPQSMFWAEI